MINLKYKFNVLSVNDKDIICPQDINKAFQLNNKIIVLLNPDADTDKNDKYQNLIAYNHKGELIWKAELPESDMVNDAYWTVSSSNPLIAKSFSSYECEIDINTGKIKNKIFYK